MFDVVKFSIFLLLMLALSGCKTITLDESVVFQPGQFGNIDTEPRTSKLRYESVLLEPTDLVIDVWADNQKAKHIIRSNSFVKSNVTHDIIDSNGEQLGITLIERSGSSRPNDARRSAKAWLSSTGKVLSFAAPKTKIGASTCFSASTTS